MSRRLEVFLYDQPVGILAENPEGGVEFRFLEEYRDLVPRPVLGQKFEDDLTQVYRSRRGYGLPDFFANLIPEGPLREVIVETADLAPDDDLALLDFVGRDLPGAVTVQPLADESLEHTSQESPPSSDERGEPPNIGLRFSLAGVQLKFSMLLAADKLTLPAKGRGGEWIVKLDAPAFPHLPANEVSMLEWARAAGFEVPECRLFDISQVEGLPQRVLPPDTQVLAIRRYDRSAEGPVHQEDLAQVVGLPPARKYDQITYDVMARLIRRFIDQDAVDELVRRLVLTVAIGNNDAHLKNWSLVYPDRIRPRWSPLYDQVATVAWPTPDRALALKLAGIKSFGQIDRPLFERFAQRAQLDPRRVDELVTGTVERLRATWRDLAPALPLPDAHREALRDHWRRVPLLRAAGALD